MEYLAAMRNGMLGLAVLLGVAACAGGGQEPYEDSGSDMERPPAMETPSSPDTGSVESQ
jgi:hypothetical protein